MSLGLSTLFTRLGKLFGSAVAVNTAYGTTLPPHFNAVNAQFSSSDSLAMQQTVAAITPAALALEANTGTQQTLAAAAASVIYQTCHEFSPQPNKNLSTTIPYLISQMVLQSATVNASSATVAITAGTNAGNTAVVASCVRPDGLNQQNALPEAIAGVATSSGIAFTSSASVNALSSQWPAGSGINSTVTIYSPTGNGTLLSNGGFDTFTVANTPDSWLIGTGTPGTDIVANVYTVQTITITGTPTGGSYTVTLTDLNGKVYPTITLAWNATASQLQAAINALGTFSVAVTTGVSTAPNWIFTLTFNGQAGDVPVVAVVDSTTGGSHSVVSASVTHGTAVYSIQKITTSGTPTSGNYTITVTDLAGRQQTTANIAYNAVASAVQSALRLLNGFGAVTVTETGSTPNFVHTINFIGLAGDVPILSVTDGTSGGSHAFAVANVRHGVQAVNLAVQFVSTGAEVTTLYQELSGLLPLTPYCFNGWFKADPVPAAGVIKVELVDGIGGQVINDAQGTPNVLTITLSGITNGFTPQNAFFRTPQVLPANVFIRLRVATAVTSGTTTTIDQCCLVAVASPLYQGGPYVAAFFGSAPSATGTAQIPADTFTVTVTNAQAGAFQTWFDRCFGMKQLGLVLPSSGSPSISDSLIS